MDRPGNGRVRRVVIGAAVIVTIAVTVRMVAAHAVLSSVVVGGAAVAGIVIGVALYARRHGRRWRAGWAILAAGLTGQVAGTVLQALETAGGADLMPSAIGSGLIVLGLVVLIRHRERSRAAEFLFEAVIASVVTGYVIWMLAEPSAVIGGPPGGALTILTLDVAVLWTATRLASMTPEIPASYRYLLAAFAIRLTADAITVGAQIGPLAETLSGSPQWRAMVLWGYCLWAAGALHPSMRSTFEPVSQRPHRMSLGRIAFVLSAMLVPAAVYGLRGGWSVTGMTVLGSTAVSLVVAGYLVHQVQERASREYRAQHDALTGLPNRVLFHDRVEVAMAHARRRGHKVGLMFLDLDRFKNINDSLGHDVGNQLLQAVAKRLRGTLREEDTVARLGGDEFTILLGEVADADGCVTAARKVAEAFDDPFVVAGRELFVTTSVGVAVFPDSADDAEALLKNADTAMYSAKARGRNGVQRYSSDMSARASVKLALESSLHGAVERSQLTLHYQPQVDLRDGRIVGLEALARWFHPELGFVSPAAFIPLAEESGLILELGERVIDMACLQNQRWHEAGLLSVPVAVNISPRQFVNGRVLSTVANALDRTGLPPELLELELTEGVFMRDLATATNTLHELRAMGIRCSIDDFGTGFSALNYLAELPIDALKIDRSFVQSISDEHDEAPIVGAVIALAHQLGMRVIAEGVETSAQSRHLRRAGCHVMQGYRFGRPVAADELEQRLFDERLVTGIPEDELGPILSGPPPQPVAHIDGAPDPEAVTALLVSAVTDGDGAKLDPEVLETVLRALRPDQRTTDEIWWRRSASLRLAAGSLAGLLPISGGLAAAGALPPTAQSVAHGVFGRVGIHVPSGSAPLPEHRVLLAAEAQAPDPVAEAPERTPHAGSQTARRVEVPSTPTVATDRRVAASATGPDESVEWNRAGQRPAVIDDAPQPDRHEGERDDRTDSESSAPWDTPLAETPGEADAGPQPRGNPSTVPSVGEAVGRTDGSAPGQTDGGGTATDGGNAKGEGEDEDENQDEQQDEAVGQEDEETTPTDETSSDDDTSTDDQTTDDTGDEEPQDTTDDEADATTDDETDPTTDDETDPTTDDETDPTTDDETDAGGPGNSGDAPGQTGGTPGLDGSAPGQSDEPTGPPGQTGDTPGQSGGTPGGGPGGDATS